MELYEPKRMPGLSTGPGKREGGITVTAKEIVRALRACASGEAEDCPFTAVDGCGGCQKVSADLIERLSGEVEDLRRKLAMSDKDGRVVVQPCKVGDILYRVFAGEIFEHRVGSMKYFAIQKRWDIETYPFCPCVESSIGKTIFLTSEEAKKALQEMEGKKDD